MYPRLFWISKAKRKSYLHKPHSLKDAAYVFKLGLQLKIVWIFSLVSCYHHFHVGLGYYILLTKFIGYN